MFRNTLTFKFGKTIGLFYLLCISAGIITIIAEKLYYAVQHTTPPDYGLAFAVIILLNAFVIIIINFLIIDMVFRTLLKLIFAFLNRHVWLCV